MKDTIDKKSISPKSKPMLSNSAETKKSNPILDTNDDDNDNATNVNAINNTSTPYHYYTIFSALSHKLLLTEESLFQSSAQSDCIFLVKLKSEFTLLISSFIKYSNTSEMILKGIILHAYDTISKKSETITLSFPEIKLLSKNFNIGRMFFFAIQKTPFNSYLCLVILHSNIFIIEIKETIDGLTSEILFKEKKQGNKLLYLGFAASDYETVFHILSKPSNSFIILKCVYGVLSHNINVDLTEDSNAMKDFPFQLERFTLTSCKWIIFTEKITKRAIIVNKETLKPFELKCATDLSINVFHLICNDDELHLLTDSRDKDIVSIIQYRLVLEHKDKDKEEDYYACVTEETYEIKCDNYDKHVFNVINDQCFYVNLQSNFYLYYLNRKTQRFESVHKFNFGSCTLLAQTFELNTFSVRNKTHVMLGVYKEMNITVFDFILKEGEVKTLVTGPVLVPEIKGNCEKEKDEDEVQRLPKLFLFDNANETAIKNCSLVSSGLLCHVDKKDKTHSEQCIEWSDCVVSNEMKRALHYIAQTGTLRSDKDEDKDDKGTLTNSKSKNNSKDNTDSKANSPIEQEEAQEELKVDEELRVNKERRVNEEEEEEKAINLSLSGKPFVSNSFIRTNQLLYTMNPFKQMQLLQPQPQISQQQQSQQIQQSQQFPFTNQEALLHIQNEKERITNNIINNCKLRILPPKLRQPRSLMHNYYSPNIENNGNGNGNDNNRNTFHAQPISKFEPLIHNETPSSISNLTPTETLIPNSTIDKQTKFITFHNDQAKETYTQIIERKVENLLESKIASITDQINEKCNELMSGIVKQSKEIEEKQNKSDGVIKQLLHEHVKSNDKGKEKEKEEDCLGKKVKEYNETLIKESKEPFNQMKNVISKTDAFTTEVKVNVAAKKEEASTSTHTNTNINAHTNINVNTNANKEKISQVQQPLPSKAQVKDYTYSNTFNIGKFPLNINQIPIPSYMPQLPITNTNTTSNAPSYLNQIPQMNSMQNLNPNPNSHPQFIQSQNPQLQLNNTLMMCYHALNSYNLYNNLITNFMNTQIMQTMFTQPLQLAMQSQPQSQPQPFQPLQQPITQSHQFQPNIIGKVLPQPMSMPLPTPMNQPPFLNQPQYPFNMFQQMQQFQQQQQQQQIHQSTTSLFNNPQSNPTLRYDSNQMNIQHLNGIDYSLPKNNDYAIEQSSIELQRAQPQVKTQIQMKNRSSETNYTPTSSYSSLAKNQSNESNSAFPNSNKTYNQNDIEIIINQEDRTEGQGKDKDKSRDQDNDGFIEITSKKKGRGINNNTYSKKSNHNHNQRKRK